MPEDHHETPSTQISAHPASLQLAQGASFEQIQAKRIILGVGPIPPHSLSLDLERWQPPIDARPWENKGWHIGHSINIPLQLRVPCALDIRGQLRVEEHCVIEGDVRVRNHLHLGSRCHVYGNLLCTGDMRIDSDCCIQGLLMAEGQLHLSPGVVIGSAQKPVSVCADVIEVVGPVLVHGRVHARTRGAIALALPFCGSPEIDPEHKDKA